MVEQDTFRPFLWLYEKNRPVSLGVCHLQEWRRSASVAGQLGAYGSFCKVQIQLTNISMDQWILHHLFSAHTTSDRAFDHTFVFFILFVNAKNFKIPNCQMRPLSTHQLTSFKSEFVIKQSQADRRSQIN